MEGGLTGTMKSILHNSELWASLAVTIGACLFLDRFVRVRASVVVCTQAECEVIERGIIGRPSLLFVGGDGE